VVGAGGGIARRSLGREPKNVSAARQTRELRALGNLLASNSSLQKRRSAAFPSDTITH